MVREEEDLRFLRERCQHLQRGPSALVVEIEQEIVEYERNRLVLGYPGFQAGGANGQIKLILSFRTHGFDAQHLRASGAKSLQDFLSFFVKIGPQSSERSGRELGKQIAGPLDDRIPVSFAVALKPAAQQDVRQLEASVLLDVVAEHG